MSVHPNPDQFDTDFDRIGYVCDPNDDNDTIPDIEDNCSVDIDTDQADENNDGVGNVCDVPEEDCICFPIKAKNGKVTVICL